MKNEIFHISSHNAHLGFRIVETLKSDFSIFIRFPSDPSDLPQKGLVTTHNSASTSPPAAVQRFPTVFWFVTANKAFFETFMSHKL